MSAPQLFNSQKVNDFGSPNGPHLFGNCYQLSSCRFPMFVRIVLHQNIRDSPRALYIVPTSTNIVLYIIHALFYFIYRGISFLFFFLSEVLLQYTDIIIKGYEDLNSYVKFIYKGVF